MSQNNLVQNNKTYTFESIKTISFHKKVENTHMSTWMDSSTAANERDEGILGIECSQESCGEWMTGESQVEEYYSTRNTGTSGVELGDEDGEGSNYPSKQEKQGEEKKKKKPLVIALSVVIPVLVIAAIAAVCCVLFIKKPTNKPIASPNITTAIEMNGDTKDIKEGELINKIPIFSPLDIEDASCYIESRFGIEGGEMGEWKKDLPSSSDHISYGTYIFEFRYMCKGSQSDVETLRFVVDPSLPDIILEPKSNILTDRWVSFTLKFPNGEDDISSITGWKVDSDDDSNKHVWPEEKFSTFLG